MPKSVNSFYIKQNNPACLGIPLISSYSFHFIDAAYYYGCALQKRLNAEPIEMLFEGGS